MLILDGHAIHSENIALLKKVHESHTLYTAKHIMQVAPLDAFMLPLSTYYTQESET